MKMIGVGLDYQHFSQYALPAPELIAKFFPRLSHASVVGLTTFKECELFKNVCQSLPIIHHLSGIEPAGLDGVQWEKFKFQNEVSKRLNAIWCGEDIGIWSIGPYSIPYFAPPVFCREVLERTVEEVKKLKAESAVPFLAEVPSCSMYVGDIKPGPFFTEMCARTQCGIVLDVSHVFSFASYFGTDLSQMLHTFPLDHVVELHAAGGSLHPEHKYRYRDTHSEPVMGPVLDILKMALDQCSALRAVTYEIGVGLPIDILNADFDVLEMIVANSGFRPRVETPASQATLFT